MRSNFLPIGARIDFSDGHEYEIVEQTEKKNLCKGCVFFPGGMLCKAPYFTPICIKHYRKDEKSVIFKKIK